MTWIANSHALEVGDCFCRIHMHIDLQAYCSSWINLHLLLVLELDNCNLLTSVALHLSRLQSISLVHCRKYSPHL